MKIYINRRKENIYQSELFEVEIKEGKTDYNFNLTDEDSVCLSISESKLKELYLSDLSEKDLLNIICNNFKVEVKKHSVLKV